MADPTDSLTAGAAALEGVLRKTREGIASLTDVFTRLGDVAANAFGNVSRMVGALNPASMRLFNVEVYNLNAAIGSVLQPVLERATAFVRRLNEVVTGMSPPLKAATAAMVTAATAATVFGSVMPVLSAAIVGATKTIGLAVDFLSGELTVLDVLSGGILPLIGAIATVAVGAGVGFGVLGDSVGGLNDLLGGLAAAAKPVTDALSGMASAVLPALAPLGNALVSIAGSVGSLLLPVIKSLAMAFEVLGPTIAVVAGAIAFNFSGIAAGLKIITDVMGVFRDAFAPIQDAVSVLFRAFSSAFAGIGAALNMLASILTGVVGGAVKALAVGIASMLRPIIEGVTWIIDQLIRAAAVVAVVADRLARAVKGEANLKGVIEEADRRVAAMKGPATTGPKPYTEAGGQASLMGVEEVSRKLQAAGFAAGQKKDAADEVDKAREEAARHAKDNNDGLWRLYWAVVKRDPGSAFAPVPERPL